MLKAIDNGVWKLKRAAVRFIEKKDGMSTIEVVIIIAILVALALIFKDFIVGLAESLFTKIQSGANEATSGF